MDSRRRSILEIVAIALLAALPFAASVYFEFVFDDTSLLLANPRIQSWTHVPSYFMKDAFAHQSGATPTNYYRPLLLLWFRLNHAIFEFKPWGWHLSTIALHVMASVLVLLAARRICPDARMALVAAALFAVHPAHTEAIAWVSGTPEPLMTIPVLAAFLLYTQAREEGAAVYTGILAWVFFVAGLLIKETAAVLPLLLLLFELARLFPGRATPRVWRLLGGFFLIFAVYLGWRYHVLGFLSRSQISVPPGTLVATWPWLVAFYMKKLVWPVGLSAFYTTPYVTTIGFLNFWLPLLSLAAAAAGLVVCARRQRSGVILAGALWMLLPLLPLLNTTVFVKEFAHDRYLYLPSFGFCLIVAALLSALGRAGLVLAGALALAGLAGAVSEAQHWRDEPALYVRGVEITPKSAMARHNLAVQLYRRGQADEARKMLHDVLADDPDFWLSNYALGEVYQAMGDCGRAVTYYSRAVTVKPSVLRPYGLLVQCLLQVGLVDEAETRVRAALDVASPSSGMSYVLGVVLEEKGDLAGAIAAYETDLAMNPRSIAKPRLDALRAKSQ